MPACAACCKTHYCILEVNDLFILWLRIAQTSHATTNNYGIFAYMYVRIYLHMYICTHVRMCVYTTQPNSNLTLAHIYLTGT